MENLAIFATGSFARHEASQHSDIDLFFCYNGSARNQLLRRTNEYKLFGRLIAATESLGYPPFSNDAEFLRTHGSETVISLLGKRDDDWHNHFTLRMLLLLESSPLHGEDAYRAVLAKIVDAYYADYPGHAENFRPWFLVNDIMRFWKTLLLNYESKAPSSRVGEDPEEARVRHKVRNFKLKFSRMTTCFATIAAIGSSPSTVQQDDVVALVGLTPVERLQRVTANLPDTSKQVDDVLVEYTWFLEQTALSKDELHARFRDKASKVAMFERANAYGQSMFALLKKIDEHAMDDQGFLRYLVV